MAKNPDAPAPSRAQVLSQVAARNRDAVLVASGVILGAAIALLGVVLGG